MLKVCLEHQREFSDDRDGHCLHCLNRDHEPQGVIEHLKGAGATEELNLKFCLKLNLNNHEDNLCPMAIILDSSTWKPAR